MNYEGLLRPHRGRRIRAALIGVGEFGRTFVRQAQAIPDLRVAALCDRDPDRAIRAYRAAGLPDGGVRRCGDAGEARRAFERDEPVVVADAALLAELPVDIVIEATGEPEAAARSALAAIEHGRHVAMVSKEADVVVGPVLAHRARRAGLVYTPVDGDQPSLLIGLVSWARTLGFRVTAAGKASEYDYIYDPARGTVACAGRAVAAVPGLAELWALPPGGGAPRVLRERAERLAAAAAPPPVTAPDFCEMGIVANATGLKPDLATFHAPILRPVELPDILRPRADGGLLDRPGDVLDVFGCLRRVDEASFAGGVFVIVECPDDATARLLEGKGIPVSRDGGGGPRRALVHNPVHLLGLEAPISVLSACLLGLPTGGEAPRPVCDLVGRAARPLAAGTVLRLGERHAIDGLDPLLVDARPAAGANPVPYYMAAGNRLRRDVPAGAVLTTEMIEPPTASTLWDLRREQDALFFGCG